MKPKKKNKPNRSVRNIVIMAVIVIVAGVVVYKFVLPPQNRPSILQSDPTTTPEQEPDQVLQTILKLNFDSMEPQVAEKIRTLAQSIQKNDRSSETWGKLAMTLHVHDFVMESIPCYKKAHSLDTSDFRWPYYCGIAMERIGMTEATQWFERSLNLRKNYSPLHLRLGQKQLDAGQIEKATSHFQTALQLDSRSSHAHFGMAQIALQKGDLQQTVTRLNQAISLNPRHAEAHGLLAEVYRRLQKPENAKRELLIQQQLPPKTAVPDDMIASLTVEGVSSYWHMMRARAHMQHRQFQEAVRELEIAIQTGSDPRYLDLLGVAYQQMNRNDEAIPLHQKALEKLPDNVDFMYNLANAYFSAGKNEQAISVMEQIKELKPKSAEVYIDFAKFLIRNGNTSRALEILREGHKQVPADVGISVRLAWMLATAKRDSLRNGSEAVRLAESARAQVGDAHAGTLQVLAAAYAETGQFQKAIEIGRRAYYLISTEDPTMADDIQKQLHLYESGQPYRQ